MKKATVLLLTLVLILSLSLPALAFTAMPSAQNLSVDGRNVECEKYNIDGSNYFKLRDIAYVLNGTGSQFSVGWDAATGTVSIVTGEAYAANGSELVIGEDKSAATVESSQTIMINGEIRSDLTVYNIGGSNFFKLRELGDALDFDVDYDSSTSTAIIRSRQPVPPADEDVIICSPENFVYKIPREELEQYLKWGFSTEPQELVFGAAGKFGSGSTVTNWKRSGRCLLITDQGATPSYHENSSNLPDSQYNVAPDLNSMFIVRGSTILDYDLKNAATVTRVEIADTVTKLDSDFSGSGITRIGVPTSVTSVNLKGLKSSLVFYGEAGSFIEGVAKKNGFQFAAATILYDIYGRTVMVTPEERALYVGHGWYGEPVVQLYAADGRTTVVPENKAADYVAVGWYENYEDILVTLYSLDGKTITVDPTERAQYLANGWYDEPVTMLYAADGRTNVVPVSKVAEYVAVGWFEDYWDVYVHVYSMDGQSKDVLKTQTTAEEANGWYTLSRFYIVYADQVIVNEGYEPAVELLETQIKKDSANAAEYQQKIDQILQQWMKAINCPVAILGYTISYNSIGTPEVNIQIRNLTQKTINRMDITWTCLDAYGKVTTDYPNLYNGNFTGYTSADSAAKPRVKRTYTWTMYSNEQTAYISNYYVESVAYSDGTTWMR